MFSFVPDQFFIDTLNGLYVIDKDESSSPTTRTSFKAALMNSSYTASTSTTLWDDTYECSGTGYTAGGMSATLDVSAAAGGGAKINIANDTLTWESLTVSDIRYVAFYEDVSYNLISVVSLGSAQSPASENFTINFSSDGIVKVKMV